MKYIILDTVTSTMDTARQCVLSGMTWPLCVRARHQTKGRGRMGRTWLEADGNLYISLIWPWPKNLIHMAPYAVGLAVYHALQQTGVSTQNLFLKWPNDVVMRQSDASYAKVGGILIETMEHTHLPTDHILLNIGLGLNTHAHPQNTPLPATDLYTLGYEIPHDRLLHHLEDALISYTPPLSSHPSYTQSIVHAWMSVCAHIHQTVTLSPTPSRPCVSGVFVGLSDTGQALLKNEQGEVHAYTTGDMLI